ncbi:hypothetical protein IMZ11_08325 [Microtetraspora sp. AC03309]|uniref:hypothetical protein n=1 Tax=Microtetraspora sp. AC03309 TaxID=2779376 RepID=UPI001E64AB40|nr:hypothetical protein [Microtetraspora sp. AC03309]MCC5575647.1 hypothetical protein [Microtetraspora sp. AC03309]
MRNLTGPVLLTAGLLMAGCAGSAERPTAAGSALPRVATKGATLDLSVLRGSGGGDYTPLDSPEALAKVAPIVAAGVVDGFQPGPTFESHKGGPPNYNVVLRVKVTQPIKGVKERLGTSIPAGVIHILLSQGGAYRDDSTSVVGWRPRRTIEEFRKALPAGISVLAFAWERHDLHELPLMDAGTQLREGTALLRVHPQGFILEDPGLAANRAPDESALVSGAERLTFGGGEWIRSKTLAEMVERLKRNGFGE